MFKVDPARAVAERRINVCIPQDLSPPLDDLPSPERYQMMLVVLEVQRFGFNLQAHDGMHFVATFHGPATRKLY